MSALSRKLGKVVSDKPHKTISVAVEWLKTDSKYQTTTRRHTKLMAHDENNTARVGDVVMVKQCRPISRKKSWTLLSVVQRTKLPTG